MLQLWCSTFTNIHQVLCNRLQLDQRHLNWICIVVILLMLTIVLLSSMDGQPHDTFSGVWCSVLFIYLTYAFLPIRMRLAVSGGIVLSLAQVISAAVWNTGQVPYVMKQVLRMNGKKNYDYKGLDRYSVLVVMDLWFLEEKENSGQCNSWEILLKSALIYNRLENSESYSWPLLDSGLGR